MSEGVNVPTSVPKGVKASRQVGVGVTADGKHGKWFEVKASVQPACISLYNVVIIMMG